MVVVRGSRVSWYKLEPWKIGSPYHLNRTLPSLSLLLSDWVCATHPYKVYVMTILLGHVMRSASCSCFASEWEAAATIYTRLTLCWVGVLYDLLTGAEPVSLVQMNDLSSCYFIFRVTAFATRCVGKRPARAALHGISVGMHVRCLCKNRRFG